MEATDNWRERLRSAIGQAAHVLPAQGPITVFIHHNTLHAFENQPFLQAVEHGAGVFGCRPYLPEERFRTEMAKGRIRLEDIRAVLREELGTAADTSMPAGGTLLDLRFTMMQFPIRTGPGRELDWSMAECGALKRFRDDVAPELRERTIAETKSGVLRDRSGEVRVEDAADWEAFALESLWQICRTGLASVPAAAAVHHFVRHRDLLLAVADADSDPAVHEKLIRFSAAYVDQGVSHWPLPGREAGFYESFCAMEGRAPGVGALDSVHDSLTALGVQDSEWDEFLEATLLALRGWGGIVRLIEERPDRVAYPVAKESLIGFLAVRLLLERESLAAAAREAIGYDGPLDQLRSELRKRLPSLTAPSVEERAFPVFQLAQFRGWLLQDLRRLSPEDWAQLAHEIEAFDGIARRRTFHLAYETLFYDRCLDALEQHERQKPNAPNYQVVTCIDEREESFRRHLEEAAPECETFGTAGFFGVVMFYKGATDAHAVPLCPVVVVPKHYVEERPRDGGEAKHERVRLLRRLFGHTAHRLHAGSRSFALGTILSAGIGVLASIPLIGRIVFPGVAARLRQQAGKYFLGPPPTRLHLERNAAEPGPAPDQVGFTLKEMTDAAERVLRDLGLTKDFAPLVLTLGHGSHSMNNPHESAHDCGACGGSVGGPNGRAIAQILNDPRVRSELIPRGIRIPEGTFFLGGLHNTCNEYVKYFDLDRLPESHQSLFSQAESAIERALGRNAHERCRRFESAPLTLDDDGARKHQDARAEDLSQVRPEWGHATNAFCVVGRRERTRGLYLDRRPFLFSYDPTQDSEAAVLTRILSAVVPVCGGISLEYYFSHVDSAGYGCGTKLPHNITGLLGVMDGAASDLRTGLPWQMVEIHEPMRLLIVCETTPEILLGIMNRNPAIGEPIRKGWMLVATLDPESNRIYEYRNGEFVERPPRGQALPRTESSLAWYRGRRDHLEFAEVAAPA